MTVEDRLFEWLATVEWEDLAPATRERTIALVLDHVGCALLGQQQPWTRTVAQHVRKRSPAPIAGGARIYGDDDRVSSAGAALVNGTAGHALDLDDTHLPTMTHPGAVIIPTVLALADERDLPSTDVLAAIVVGYELASRVGRAVGLAPGERGFHGTSVQGVLGAAAAAVRARRGYSLEMRHAVGIAGSLGSGIKAFQQGPGWVKRLHAGHAAEGGLFAGELAEDGFQAPAAPLTGRFGFVRVFTPEVTTSAIDTLVTPGASSWAVDEVYIKPYPACAAVHGGIEAARAAADALPSVSDIASIRLGVPQRVLEQNDIPAPDDALRAQYSAQYATALGLLGLAESPASYLEHEHPDLTGAHELAARIELTRDADVDAAYPASNEAVLELTLQDGTVLREHGYSRPADSSGWDAASRKYESVIAPTLGERSARILAAVDALDSPTGTTRDLLDQIGERPGSDR